MLTQKLYRNGNSVAVTIPKEYLDDLNLKEGNIVVVKTEGKSVVITPKEERLSRDVNAKFAKMVNDFVNDHRDVLEELAKR